MYLRCIQCEIQNALGGALTNVCVAGMTLLKPMVTMVSYVVGERDNAFFRPSAEADQMLAEIQVGTQSLLWRTALLHHPLFSRAGLGLFLSFALVLSEQV